MKEGPKRRVSEQRKGPQTPVRGEACGPKPRARLAGAGGLGVLPGEGTRLSQERAGRTGPDLRKKGRPQPADNPRQGGFRPKAGGLARWVEGALGPGDAPGEARAPAQTLTVAPGAGRGVPTTTSPGAHPPARWRGPRSPTRCLLHAPFQSLNQFRVTLQASTWDHKILFLGPFKTETRR